MNEEELYDSYRCPNCKQLRGIDKLTHLFKWHRQYRFPHMISVLSAARQEHPKWACDDCIKKEKVLIGRPEQQNWTGFAYPFFTYNDEILKCENCDCEFLFSKEEKKFWYEDLKFIVWSYPKHCPACRKQIRAPKIKSKRLTELINNIDHINGNEIEEIINIFLEYGNFNKAKYYLSVLRKRKLVEETRIDRIKEKINNLAQHRS